MITKTYFKGCDWCGGTGSVPPLYHTTSNIGRPCPVCDGSGRVTVVEKEETPETNIQFHISGETLSNIMDKPS